MVISGVELTGGTLLAMVIALVWILATVVAVATKNVDDSFGYALGFSFLAGIGYLICK